MKIYLEDKPEVKFTKNNNPEVPMKWLCEFSVSLAGDNDEWEVGHIFLTGSAFGKTKKKSLKAAGEMIARLKRTRIPKIKA